MSVLTSDQWPGGLFCTILSKLHSTCLTLPEEVLIRVTLAVEGGCDKWPLTQQLRR